ncbi:MAG: Mu transposase C-terminal domain-containing protein [Alphaproteobacteria bacterium]|nr:Mu transposase C-terminal domain-containing protein [Alphaproteobacteria bacterium]
MKEWFTAAELAALALPDLPATKRGVNAAAKKAGWDKRLTAAGEPLCRARRGNGGGREYHYSLLPQRAQLKLVSDARAARVKAEPASAKPDRPVSELWRWFEGLPESRKETARDRLAALESVIALERGGLQKNAAVAAVARRVAKGARTIWTWFDLVAAADRADWLPYLAPQHQGRTKTAACHPRAWAAFKADYLRLEPVTAEACYERLVETAAVEGWAIPSLRTLMRRIETEIPAPVRVLLREGPEALKRRYPAQERDRSHFTAMQAVNADGHKMDVWVKMPDGSVIRPVVLAIQDLFSGKILSWRIDAAETATGVRLAFLDVFKNYGIPELAYLDNGRGFAAKLITGGQPTRFRFKVSPEEMSGVLTQLGVEVHWTTPYSGQSKPIERAFRDVCERISMHPAFAGCYTGNSPANKPDYTPKAVDFDAFLQTFERGIIAHNRRPQRRTKVCGGVRSFDEAFEASYETAIVKQAGEAQLRMAMLAAEAVTARQPDGAVHLLGNRFWSKLLSNHVGEKLTVRFDPDNLHAGVHLYRRDGAYLGFAEVLEAVGFDSVDAARDHNRKRREFVRSARRAAELEQEMSIEEWVRMQPEIEPPPPPAARTVRMVAGAAAPARAIAQQANEEADATQEDYAAMTNVLRLVEAQDE